MLKVLVVVDERIILKMINTWLNDKYEIINCRTTDTLDFTGISCALVQIRSTNWASVAQAIAKAGMPFIALCFDQDDKISAIIHHCDGHVDVPFEKEELREQVDECIFKKTDAAKNLAGIVSKNIISNNPDVPSYNFVDTIRKFFQRNT